ncbi:MAG: bifunctional 2-C-methyl-D-erythritol 4-phosphate cytidylyltransferase/2-C-methyl-D-erythritol 2,4-cyclodiphosphate synthase [Alphaproteobacteria bacterium]|nr:bifunctional 2-C-methyl-D-erythritol 4-phosphate cytidylyltransferase/2-C-methyl-D-erythritol 2,4-cyclodiphosphate synthase [Alphaproteobacteria bacterium]
MASTLALIVAGGRGVRAGGGLPKQYRPLGGIPLLRHTVRRFAQHPQIDGICVVIHPDDRALYVQATEGFDLLDPVNGGATRQESCRNGLEALAAHAPANVLIHDAARPFVDAGTISRVIGALSETAPAAIAAVPVADTLKRADAENRVCDTVDRTGLWRAQTPQGFRYGKILAAHQATEGQNLTDDAAVAEAAGLPVMLTQGSAENIKVTTPEDFSQSEQTLQTAAADFRTGTGFDVHPFEDGDHVMLCGVAVPHTRGLAGHSDSDVGLHALTDALLGTIGAGDIGSHFPPSDPQWRGVDSRVFLSHAADLVTQRGGTIRHVDLTLICEAPKVGPHREAMRTRLAELLSIDIERVSVKATTTDGLGFLGRGEGIAAQAAATVLFA